MLSILSSIAVAIMSLPVAARGQVWTGARLIDAGGGKSAYSPRVACDAGVTAMAVFNQWDGANDRIYANRWNGSSWTGAGAIDAGPGNDAYEPRVAFSGTGKAIAVFSQWNGTDYRVYANRWNGSSWTGAVLIDAGPGHNAYSPWVAGDGTGKAVVVFNQEAGGYYRVYANRWNGSSWSGAVLIDAGPGKDAYEPRVAFDGSGNAIAVFIQSDGTTPRVYTNRWNGSSWTGAVTIDAGPGKQSYEAQIALDGTGKALAVFVQSGGTHTRVYANRWNGSSWTGAVTIDTGPGNDAYEPQIAFAGSSEAMAVFRQKDGVNWRIYVNRWNGSSWSGGALIDTGPGNSAFEPQVAFGGSGNATAVFRQFDGEKFRVYANRWNGSSWTGAVTIDAGLANNAYEPQIAFDGAGTVTAVFDQSNGANERVYATRGMASSSMGPLLSTDYNGDGTSDIAIFRGGSGLWAVRGITRVYFGGAGDDVVPGDYNGNGTTDIGIFRPAAGLWAIRGVTRAYFGSSADTPVPGDYNGDGTDRPGIFRSSSGLWAVKGVTRRYFGSSADTPVPGDYSGNGSTDIGIFRPAAGLWAVRGVTRAYFGSSADTPVPGDYNGNGKDGIGIFRASAGLWAVKGVTRRYFGSSADSPVPADYSGNGTDRIGIFRSSAGLWAAAGVTRVYFGGSSDVPVTR